MATKFRFPTEDEIRTRAYQIYLERGCKPGHADDDWLQAEYELMHLPIQKIAELEAIPVESKKAKNLKLVRLACSILKPKKQSRRQPHPLWNPPLIPNTTGMAASA